MDLPNKIRNEEVASAIENLKALRFDLGAQSMHHVGIATASASLDIAESLQIASLQIEQSSLQDRVVLDKAFRSLIDSNERLANSNEKYAKAMMWLTGALVLVGLAQIFVSLSAYK